ncbi:hypothetical protein L211DRAFT_853033 [Terfezia boudieri ATCC MYA-4762]|uniref:Uncharacterized protein n=1 Tax=Terfezia boudieri ATCC MYA-4762 TaxID=1051890 RepID=A0A3N4L9U0_9PEZI|nr:hypothetical protein L211DRAFT_853033 [Terfezia boudieri ATCC MYA-4762]
MPAQSRSMQDLYNINMPADTAFNAAYNARPPNFTRNQHEYALQQASDRGYHFYTQYRGNVHTQPQGMGTLAQINTMRHVMGPHNPTSPALPIAGPALGMHAYPHPLASVNMPMAHTYRHMADPTMVVTPQLQYEHLAYEQQPHQRQLSLEQGPVQGMHGYPAHDPVGMTLNSASRNQFNTLNAMYNPQIMSLANSNEFNWQLQSGQRQNHPAVFSEQSREPDPGQAQDIWQLESGQCQNHPAVFSEQSRGASPGQAQDIHLNPMPTNSRPSVSPLPTLSQSQGEKIQTSAPSPSPPVATEEAVAVSKNGWSEVSPNEKERGLLNGEVLQSCKRKIHSESLEIATAVAPQRKRARTEKRKERERTTPASTGDDELTIINVNLLTPSSSPISRTSGDKVTTGTGILTPSPSVSPPTNNLGTSTTTASPVSSDQFFPKTRRKGGRTTTYTNFAVAPYDISRANQHLAYNMPRKIAMSRKRWITNPEEFPRLERLKKQVVDDDPDAVFEVDERGEKVLSTSAHPQGNAAAEREDDQSGGTDEVPLQGSGELVVEKGVTHVRSVHEKTPPATSVPTSQVVPISPPGTGRGVKLTEEEKKARRRQRDRERYQRKNGAATVTSPKKAARPSPTGSNKKGVAKRTAAKSPNTTALTPSATRQHADEDKEDYEEFDIWQQIGLEIQKLPPVDRTAELEVDKDAGGNSSVWSSNGEGQPNALDAEDQRRNLLRSEGEGQMGGGNSNDDYLTSLFEE